MAEESSGQERTEEPTPRRLEKAREEGQVARSRELMTVALIAVGALGLLVLFPRGSNALLGLAERFFGASLEFPSSAVGYTQMQAADFQAALSEAVWVSAIAIGPLLAMLAIASLAASGALGGFVVSAKAMSFKGERLSPIKGLKRILSVQSLVELLKSIGKFLLIAGAAVAFLWQMLDLLFALGDKPLGAAVGQGLRYVGWALLLFALVLILIAAIDVPFQINQHRKQLRMTKQEVKDELKDSEGKPEVKAAQRRAQQALANTRMLDAVPTADVVITNPEHFAVALKYELGAPAPTVVARGTDHLALRIRAAARRASVPELRLPPLARSIYYHCDLGTVIPAPLYAAVAEVLAYVTALSAFRSGARTERPKLRRISVPRALQRDAEGREPGS